MPGIAPRFHGVRGKKRLAAQDLADFIADAEVFPGPVVLAGGWWSFLFGRRRRLAEIWFGLVMNSERIVHRKSRRRLAEMNLMTSEEEVPYAVFRSAAYSAYQARTEYDDYTIALQRAVQDARRGV